MRYLLNAAQMKQADRYTMEHHGIASMELMERAAEASVKFMEEQGLDVSDVCVVCGSGNNGGDGMAIARLLSEKNLDVTVVFAGKEEHCTQETGEQLALLKNTTARISNCFEAGEYSILVDAVFGVGLSREVEGEYAVLIEDMNKSEGFKLAVDIPSGISADSGCVMGTAFKADATVTFQEEKLGLKLYPGREYAGELHVADIGIDTDIMEMERKAACTFEPWEYREMMPVRKPDSNKGTYGKLLVIAGSKGMAGAAYLNAKAAYMTGAGLVQIYTAEENRVILQGMLPEAIMRNYEFFDEGELIKLLRWADTVLIGSGIGTSDKSRRILRTVMENVEVPCIIDADALNLIADNMRYMHKLAHNAFIFTPHMKEMTRLTDKDMDELKRNRMEILDDFTETYGVTCVLKDSVTISMSENMRPYVNLTGNAAMAKAGSGDVLAGVIGGLLVQGLSISEAAILGTYLHGRSGDLAREDKGSYSVMAGDLINYLSVAMKEQEEK